MGYFGEYYLRLDNGISEEIHGYDDPLRIKAIVADAQRIAKEKGCGGHLIYRAEGKEIDTLIIESDGMVRAHQFVFNTNRNGKWDWIQFNDMDSLLDYAQRWYEETLMHGPVKYHGTAIVRWIDMLDDWHNMILWEYRCPDDKTVYYSTDDGAHWCWIEEVPNTYNDLFACLMAYDLQNNTVYSKYLRPQDITTIEPEGEEYGEFWNDPVRFYHMLRAKVFNDIPRLMVIGGLSLREAMVYSIEATAELTTSEVTAFMSRLLGASVLPQTVVRARNDARAKMDKVKNQSWYALVKKESEYPIPERDAGDGWRSA